MTAFRWIWVGWIVFFLIVEFTALIRKTDGTLSSFVWWLCDITPGKTTWNWSAVHVFVFAFLIWLLAHLSFGLFR